MSIIRNDLGNPSNEPCGITVLGICGSGDYDAWHSTASQIASKLNTTDDPRSASWRVEFLEQPDPDSLGVSFFPSTATQNLARLAQEGADLLQAIGESIPPTVTRNANLPAGKGQEARTDIATTVVVVGGLGLLGFIAYKLLAK